MRYHHLLFATITTVFLSACAGKEVPDEAVGAYSFTAVAETVGEGEDIPVHLSFRDAGLVVDNPSWGDKWKGATFYAEMTDAMNRTVENVIYSGPGGVIGNGSVLDIAPTGKMDIIVGGLRQGNYNLKINLRTRYTVDTWASVSIIVRERTVAPVVTETVLVDDFTVPGKDNGLEIDDIGNVILDLRFFNAANPFIFRSTVRPDNATDKQLIASSGTPSVAGIRVDGETTLVITPAQIGTTTMTVQSRDGNAKKTFSVKVIESVPDADGFTLPTDDNERDNYDLDVAGRLALDINKWNDGNPFTYTCNPIPADASIPGLKAESDTPAVVVAAIEGGNRLVLTPKSPGYAVVTVSTMDGAIVRKMRVAVISNFRLTIDAVEGTPSEDDKKTAIFPCKLTLKTDSQWYPTRMRVEVYAKAIGRVDLTDAADYFLVDSLKNARTAYYSVEDQIPVLYLSNGNSAYQLYDRVLKKVAAQTVDIHHADDWPNYYDYTVNYRLNKISLSISVIEEFDTNLYRATLVEKYNSPNYRLYQYLL